MCPQVCTRTFFPAENHYNLSQNPCFCAFKKNVTCTNFAGNSSYEIVIMKFYMLKFLLHISLITNVRLGIVHSNKNDFDQLLRMYLLK